MKKYILWLVFTIALFNGGIYGAYLTNLPTTITQPNGEVIHCYASGDEFFNWLHDENGYTIIQSQTDGYYYYAIPNGENVKPSKYKVNSVNPEKVGLKKWVKISERLYKERRNKFYKNVKNSPKAPHFGTLNNINIFIRFSDQDEFVLSREYYDGRFNATGANVISIRTYYEKVSYGNLHIITHHYPVCDMSTNLSYKDPHPRSYYSPYNSTTNPIGYQTDYERRIREHTLLKNAIQTIASEVPSDLNIDGDNDGYVDNVCFIIRGPHDAWADLLWAHMWHLYTYTVQINGKTVDNYTFQPEDQNSAITMCHEMFHALGAPDLYHYSYDGITPAGPWDIMEYGHGHMLAFMKYKYGHWIDEIPEITTDGLYTLNPLTESENNCYKIRSPYSSTEYFVVEYRLKNMDQYEASLPGSGLLVYRINTTVGNGNADGPPDEIYIYRPNGTVNTDGYILVANFSSDVGRTEINDATNPNSFLTDGTPGGLNIYNIGSADNVITFQVSFSNTFLPVCEILSPQNYSYLPNSNFLIKANAELYNGNISYVNFLIDNVLVQTIQNEPYEYLWDMSSENLGNHQIIVIAHDENDNEKSDTTNVILYDYYDDHWFNWMSNNPSLFTQNLPENYDFEFATDFDLGANNFYLRKISLYADEIGDTLISCKIVTMNDYNLPTNQVLLDLGTPIITNSGTWELNVDSDVSLSGKIAFVIGVKGGSSMTIDQNGVNKHAFFRVPDLQPWQDLSMYGLNGALTMQLLLSTPRTLQGTITNVNGENIENATIKLYSLDADPATTSPLSAAISDENGHYYIETKDEGTYKVIISKFAYQDYIIQTDIQAADNVLDAILNPVQPVNIVLNVNDENGTAINNATIEIYRHDTSELIYTNDKNYQMEVVPYCYDFKISANGYLPFTKQITVVNDTTLNFALHPIEGIYSDFESDNGSLVSNSNDGWQWGSDNEVGSYSGDKVWGTVLNGDYANGAHWSLDLPEMEIGDNWIMSWYQWHDFQVSGTSAIDGGNIKISTDGGTTFSVLTTFFENTDYAEWVTEEEYESNIMEYLGNPLDGELTFYGTSEEWKRVTLDLSAYSGMNVILRFDFGSDYGVNQKGWYIDNLYVGKIVTLDIDDSDNLVIPTITLHQNYPNPFNPTTTIKFQISHKSYVNLSIFDVNGNLITTLVNNELPKGEHKVIWNGKNKSGYQVSSGIYFYRIDDGINVIQKKMLLLK